MDDESGNNVRANEGDAASIRSRPEHALGPDVISVHERLAHLEALQERESRSWVGRASKSMSLIALIISLVAGGYGLLDSFYLRLAREADRDAEEVRQIVRRITELNAQLSPLVIKHDYQGMAVASSIANGEKIPLLARANELISKNTGRKRFVDPGALLVLSTENLSFANNKIALEYAKTAALLSEDSPLLRAQALGFQGRALFAPGKDQDTGAARDSFGKARDIINNFPSFISGFMKINTIGDWIIAEASFGSCKQAQQLWGDLLEETKQMKVPADQVNALIDNYKKNPWLNASCQVM
ncbi:MAG TPA: hypothetical protein VGE72_25575 [Azospirillum sp.]